ncbi:MAG: aldehyde dehydrogenase family protein [Treponema sp.]|nr:MAG: aldehyde dehydrogenase family protein [Treponema sp.]
MSSLIQENIEKGRSFFNTGASLNYAYRKKALLKFREVLKNNKTQILDALQKDLNKTHYEGFMTEYALVMSELSLAIKKLRKWMKPQRKMPALSQMPASAKLYSEPYGLVLIMSPWNYPFQLCIIPLIAAIAAGNTVIVKPSAYSKHTSDIIAEIVKQAFNEGHVSVILGGREENSQLLNGVFDYIFFTGSPTVGKLVMQKAANNMTPFTLELGGKSPCIIAEDADIKVAAKRIAFGKILNSGQICVAPDYALISENIADLFIAELIKAEQSMLKSKEYASKCFPKIINEKHRKRILGLIEASSPTYQTDFFDPEKGQIPFTIIKNPDENSPVMQEEIFGPVLPVITYKNIDEAFAFIKKRPKPLALYLFTDSRPLKHRVTKEISYGGGCINDTVIHLASHSLPFGGVGNSGIGHYHGKYGFDTFSHKKSVLSKWKLFDLPVRYHPIKDAKKTLPQILFDK